MTGQFDETLRQRVRSALFADTEVGSRGRFEILDRIGEGGMGVVYRARDPDLDREVAIKVLRPSSSLGTTGRTRLQREARAMAKLSHPNVAHVYEVATTEDEVYIVMEYIPGETLRAWTAAHEGSTAELLAMYRAAGEGLHAAHEAGFVHRDFKPDNVLVGRDGRPRVLDFGLATALESASEGTGAEGTAASAGTDLGVSLTATGTMVGTPAYMAPEQFLGEATDARTDQFAFCVALWEALRGERPFAGASIAELSENVREGRLRDAVDPELPAVFAALRRGLSSDPGARFATIRELLAALEPAPQPASRTRAILVGVLVTLAVGGAASLALPRRSPPPPASASTNESTVAPPVVDSDAVAVRQLTRTPGFGVQQSELHRSGERFLYVAEGSLFVADVVGNAVPRRVELDATPLQIRFDPQGTGFIAISNEGKVQRIVEGAPTVVLPFEISPDTSDFALSPDGERMVTASLEGAALVVPGAANRTLLDNRRPSDIAWSPDGDRIAVLAWQVTEEQPELWLFDRAGELLDRQRAGVSIALAWIGTDRLVTGTSGDKGQGGLECWTSSDEGLRRGKQVALPDLGAGQFKLSGNGEGALVLTYETSTRRDIAYLPLSEGGVAVEVSPGMRASSGSPTWLSADRFAYLTDRFGQYVVMVHSLGAGTEQPVAFPEFVPRDCASPGPELLLCIGKHAGAQSRIASLDVEAQSWTFVPDPPPWVDEISHLQCVPTGACAVARAVDGKVSIHTLSASTGEVGPPVLCPPDVPCLSRWTLGPDGDEVLARTNDERSIVSIALSSGAIERMPPPASEGFITQSARRLRDGSIVATQMGDGSGHEDTGGYRIVRIDDEAARVLVTSENEWMIQPAESPDGRHIAYTFLEFHFEAGFSDATELCR